MNVEVMRTLPDLLEPSFRYGNNFTFKQLIEVLAPKVLAFMLSSCFYTT